jgi:3,4-dihydroxy-2-butanone 4-phosphate synthase
LHIKTVDGDIHFATHFINVTTDESLRNHLPTLQIEKNGIVCYSIEEFNLAEVKLKELKLEYTSEKLAHDIKHKEKSKGIKYGSRSEAIEHLQNDKEVASEKENNMKKRIAQLESEIKAIKAHLKLS